MITIFFYSAKSISIEEAIKKTKEKPKQSTYKDRHRFTPSGYKVNYIYRRLVKNQEQAYRVHLAMAYM